MTNKFKYEVRPVKGYEGEYSVSNTGEVFSHKGKSDKKMKPRPAGNGYLRVTFSRNGKQEHRYVHRLVLTMFTPNPHNKEFCDHIDGDKTNNHVSNLRWCTRKENVNNPITRKNLGKNIKGGYDKTIYTFYNTKSKQVFIGLRRDLITKYDLCSCGMSYMIKGLYKSHNSWTIISKEVQ